MCFWLQKESKRSFPVVTVSVMLSDTYNLKEENGNKWLFPFTATIRLSRRRVRVHPDKQLAMPIQTIIPLQKNQA